ncbi:hypothetical protein ONZ45_g3063 [Pleurotus djamor]|nr:hypothetical protein ONZ45_g3063 [Pleurotus djamor]
MLPPPPTNSRLARSGYILFRRSEESFAPRDRDMISVDGGASAVWLLRAGSPAIRDTPPTAYASIADFTGDDVIFQTVCCVEDVKLLRLSNPTVSASSSGSPSAHPSPPLERNRAKW